MPTIPADFTQAPLSPSRPPEQRLDHVYLGNLASPISSREIPLAAQDLLIHIRYPSRHSPGCEAFRASFDRSAALQTFILESYAFIEDLLKPSHRRHPVIGIVLDHQDGLAQTGNGVVTISCVWLDSWQRKIEDAAKRGQEALRKEIAAFDQELRGVVLHELVHLIQFDGHQTTPSWFIESLADYIRLRAGLAAANWGPAGSGPEEHGYKEGYGVGAKFLHWIEHGKDTQLGGEALRAVKAINTRLEKGKWDNKWIVELAGGSWEHLWRRYKQAYV